MPSSTWALLVLVDVLLWSMLVLTGVNPGVAAAPTGFLGGILLALRIRHTWRQDRGH